MMAVFLILAGLLLLLTLFAVLRPLAQKNFALSAAIAVACIVTSGALYWQFGTPAALDPAMLKAPETLAEARAQLETRMKGEPDDPDGWRLLARAYTAEARLQDAADAYARAAKLSPDDPDVLTEAAEARAMAAPNRRFDAAATEMLQHALQINAQHQRARWFLGISQLQAGQTVQATETWTPLLTQISDEKTVTSLLAQLNEARAEAGLPPLEKPAAEATPGGLAVHVTLDADFASRVELPSSAQVFVIAHAADGPPMPVAVQRHPISALPLNITLSDADSPMPTMKLSELKQVSLLARISISGQANKQEGDIESIPVSVDLPASQPVAISLGAH